MEEQQVVVRYGTVSRRQLARLKEHVTRHGSLQSHDYEGGYTYRTDLKLKVGDLVEVPPTRRTGYEGEPELATVIEVGSDFKGPTHKVLRRHRHKYVLACSDCGKVHP